jgi:Zn-dependent M28 family amino/carboxypeptidase
LKKAGYNVEGHWNNDIVGTGKNEPFAPINDHTIRLFGASIYYPNVTDSATELEVGLTGGWNDSPAQNLGRFIAEVVAGAAKAVGMQVALIYRADRFLRGGDHLSFLEEGFPAVRFTEAVEDFAHQHQVYIFTLSFESISKQFYRTHDYKTEPDTAIWFNTSTSTTPHEQLARISPACGAPLMLLRCLKTSVSAKLWAFLP